MSWAYVERTFKMWMDRKQYNILKDALEAEILPMGLTKKAVNYLFFYYL